MVEELEVIFILSVEATFTVCFVIILSCIFWRNERREIDYSVIRVCSEITI